MTTLGLDVDPKLYELIRVVCEQRDTTPKDQIKIEGHLVQFLRLTQEDLYIYKQELERRQQLGIEG